MKLIILLLCVGSIHVSASTYGQKVSFNVKGERFKQVLAKIRKQSGRDFLYNAAQVDENKRVDLSVQDKQWTIALDELLKTQGLSYEIGNHNVLIFPKNTNNPASNKLATNAQQSLTGSVIMQDNSPAVGATVKLMPSGQTVSTN
ncbi:MAG: STN domain-containing protein, partial [Sphingobacterium sp.]